MSERRTDCCLQASAGAAASGPDEGVLQSLRDYKGYGLVCNWVGYLEEEGAGDGYSSSDSEGPGSNEEGGSDSDGAAIHRLPQVSVRGGTMRGCIEVSSRNVLDLGWRLELNLHPALNCLQVPTSPATTAAQLAEALTSYLEGEGQWGEEALL